MRVALATLCVLCLAGAKKTIRPDTKTLEAKTEQDDLATQAGEIDRAWSFVDDRIGKIATLLKETNDDRSATARLHALFSETGNIVQQSMQQLSDESSRKQDDLAKVAAITDAPVVALHKGLEDAKGVALGAQLCAALQTPASSLRAASFVQAGDASVDLGAVPMWRMLHPAFEVLKILASKTAGHDDSLTTLALAAAELGTWVGTGEWVGVGWGSKRQSCSGETGRGGKGPLNGRS